MKRIIIILYVIVFTLLFCRSEKDFNNDGVSQAFTDHLEESIANIESTAAFAQKVVREGIVPLEETEKHYNKIVDMVEDITEMIKESSYAYTFVKAKGIDRVFMPNISVKNSKLRVSLLELLKVLFEQLPTTTNAGIPIYAIDKLVDIFDTDENLGIKAHALDILSVWLVGNPKAQVRVMKMRGLEPFYRQIPKLSLSVTSSLLELFNKVLEEHIKVRNDMRQTSKADSDKYILYQRIGLIEQVSTASFCDGLLNIFYSTWSHTSDAVPLPIFKLIKNTLPYCGKFHRGQKRAIKLFNALSDHIRTSEVYRGLSDTNLTDVMMALDEYVKDIKNDPSEKDEF